MPLPTEVYWKSESFYNFAIALSFKANKSAPMLIACECLFWKSFLRTLHQGKQNKVEFSRYFASSVQQHSKSRCDLYCDTLISHMKHSDAFWENVALGSCAIMLFMWSVLQIVIEKPMASFWFKHWNALDYVILKQWSHYILDWPYTGTTSLSFFLKRYWT